MSQEVVEETPVAAAAPTLEERLELAGAQFTAEAEPDAVADTDAVPAAEEKPAEVAVVETPKDPEAEAKPRNVLRDLNAEWANVRRGKQALQKYEQELVARAREVEQRDAEAAELAAMAARGDLVGLHERIAARANLKPSEALARLQQQYSDLSQGKEPTNGDGNKAVLEELIKLRGEIAARDKQEQEIAARRQHEQRFEQIHQEETKKILELANDYKNEFPTLQRLSATAREKQIAAAVRHFMISGEETGRVEVLQAVDSYIKQQLDDLEIPGMGGTQAATPAAPAEKIAPVSTGSALPATSAQKANAVTRTVPTTLDAANGSGLRRKLTMEERLLEAGKALQASMLVTDE